MELTHSFTVPTSVDDTWAHFNDIASVAQCFPGATLTETDGETFSGSVKVKLGPIALVYNGSGTFTEKDESSHTMKIEAKGKDKRGNGTAGANVMLTMAPEGDATTVDVSTDLSITGKPAQFGRGVIQDVSDKLLGQFVTCLEQNLSGPAEETTSEPPAAVATPAAPQAGAEPPKPAAPPPPTQHPSPDEAIDLGSTVLPVIAKAYWKQGAGALAALLVILWWVFGRD